MGALSCAARLSSYGYKVTIFEKNAYPGGKLCELKLNNYRFDKGPSLFTLPNLVDEVLKLSPKPIAFDYKKLEVLTHYFFEDGTFVKSFSDKNKLATELKNKLGEDEDVVLKHLSKSAFFYKLTAPLFLEQSLHKITNFLNFKTIKGIANSWRLQLFTTMNAANAKKFNNEKTVQLFNRYATYNGSNPYQAPALLNIIPHLEFNLGAYIPKNGMYAITDALVTCCENLGVTFNFNAPVEKIIVEKETAIGLISNSKTFYFDSIVSDADMHIVYERLLPNHYLPNKLLNQQKSSSAFIFYWGIKKVFNELDLHNVFFSENYKAEFDCLFNESKPYHDPTVYINISSKYCKEDAPEACENWFVMVNVPHNKEHKPISYKEELKINIINKLNRLLKTDIQNYIECEEILDPYGIEIQTGSYGGSLYGNASNNRFSAFLRHANYSSKIKNLYFAGGSVHPGGGIPLSLLSGKIVSDLIYAK